MKATLGAGLALTLLVSVVVALVWDRGAAQAAAGFGLLATAIHLAAEGLLRRALARELPFGKVMARVAAGMGLRLAGAALWAVAVLLDRGRFPPLPSAVGYVVVLIPLLFAEARLLR